MKKVMLLVAAICALTAVPVLAGPTVTTLANWGPWQIGSGGEFTLAFADWGWDPLPLYADVAKNQYTYQGKTPKTFQTFCLEKNEFVTIPNQTYDVVFNDGAVAGGVGGSVGGKDPISKGTAYLYHEFQKGTLVGYDYLDTTPGVSRKASAAALQDAIWYLEGEITVNPNNVFTQAVIANVINPMANNNGTYAVAVLNLYQGTTKCQDMLVCVPAPGAILLGGIGVSLVGWLRRRRTL